MIFFLKKKREEKTKDCNATKRLINFNKNKLIKKKERYKIYE